jgi:hypothetical protein
VGLSIYRGRIIRSTKFIPNFLSKFSARPEGYLRTVYLISR